MATYKFEQFAAEIENPTIEVSGVLDNMDNTCSVNVTLISGETQLGVTLMGFSYGSTWSDADISKWVNSEIEKFKI